MKYQDQLLYPSQLKEAQQILTLFLEERIPHFQLNLYHTC